MADNAAVSPTVEWARHGAALRVELARPAALNALDLPMIAALTDAFETARTDADCRVVAVSGRGGRAFCAGGDIRAIYRGLEEGRDVASRFWRTEYDLLVEIERFPKPVVALMDGIVMGGGVGLAMHASHRVATERTRLAMPEVGIGFLPDVGATWRLPKAPDHVGTWMAMTGDTVGAADARLAGLVDHVVASDSLAAIQSALATLPRHADTSDVTNVIRRFEIEPEPERLESQRALLTSVFDAPSLDAAIVRLAELDDPFARETLATIRSRSPMSLHVTWRLLELGARSPSLAACLDREFDAAVRVLRHPDFREGVRAAVVDKDRNPRWREWTAAEAADWDAFLADAGRKADKGAPR